MVMRKSKEKTSSLTTTNDIIVNPNKHSCYVRSRIQEYFQNFIKIKSPILLSFFIMNWVIILLLLY